MNDETKRLLMKIRLALGVFMVFLVLSGITAFPLLKEMNWVVSVFNLSSTPPSWFPIGGLSIALSALWDFGLFGIP